jgi:NADP-dependent 3-hydroxy acid dehydrogenase YdfG
VSGTEGSVGAAFAKEFAAEGVEVFLAGRTRTNVESVAKQIRMNGCAQAAVIEATDDSDADDYLNDIAKRTGSIDIVFNAIGRMRTSTETEEMLSI